MDEIHLKLNDLGHGAFFIMDGTERIAFMDIGISEDKLIAYHTEVAPEAEGKGLAKKLLSHMVEYARQHHLKVIPLCPFVNAQFNRHPEQYADIWEKRTENP
jgi:predicted GNAT family acetyltransferase